MDTICANRETSGAPDVASAVAEAPGPRERRVRLRFGQIVPSSYDISDRCNLTCEGCLFFAGSDRLSHPDDAGLADWDAFFAGEAARGVNFAYVAGAEPSLQLDRIRCIQRHIPRGVVFTNGTRRIPSDIRYRLHISVWGAPEENARLRGADNLGKALRLYANDPRAVFVYTVSRNNIADIPKVAATMAAHGAKLTFSYWSPTTDYLDPLARSAEADAYLRSVDTDVSPMLTASDLARASEEIARALAAYPETVRYSLDYDRWVTGPSPYTIDPQTGIALDCGNRLTTDHHHYGVDLRRSTGKCCSPNIDCSGCRAYAQGNATYLDRSGQARTDRVAMKAWLATREIWAELFLPVDPAS